MTITRRIAICLLAALAIANAPLNYVLDAAASSVSAKVAFFGIASKTAGFPTMSGKVRIVPDRPQEALIDVTIDARALTAPDKVTLARLRGEKFFWVERYPNVHFIGHRLTMRDTMHGTVEGRLTARGVTRNEALEVTFDSPPGEGDTTRPVILHGEMEIDRRDYGMTAYRFIVGRKVTIRLTARMVPAA